MDKFGILALFTDHTLRTVALGSALLGASAGLVSVYAVLRRQSLLGDAISHAALPGVVLAFLLTGGKEPAALLIGALVVGWLSALLVLAITRTTRIALDGALGLILSVSFGAGLVLLTFVQRRPDASQAGLDRFLFGQAASLLQRDILVIAGGTILVMVVTLLFWKELALRAFDPDYAAVLGLPGRFLDVLMSALVVLAIVLGLQVVGVVLMSALVVAPAAAARQWTDRLGIMVILSVLFGASAGLSGALLSSLVPRLPTGPTSVLIATGLVVCSLLAAPARGLLWRWWRARRVPRVPLEQEVLARLALLAERHRSLDDGHPVAALQPPGWSLAQVARCLQELADRGVARQVVPGQWTITHEGLQRLQAHHQHANPGEEAER